MTKVYIIRHAEAEGNLYRRIHGQYNSNLTKLGMMQLNALEKRFQNIDIQKVYSSDLKRTMTTATAITRNRGIDIEPLPQIREIFMGRWEDLEWGNAEWYDREQLIAFNQDPAMWSIEGGENFYALQDRMLRAVLETSKKDNGKTIAMFSHGAAIRALTAKLRGLSSDRVSQVKFCDNTAVMELDIHGDSVDIVYEGDSSHISQQYSRFQRQKWHREGGNGLDASNLRIEAASQENIDKAKKWYTDLEWHTLTQDQVYAAFHSDEYIGLVAIDTHKYAAISAGIIDICCFAPQWKEHRFLPQLIGKAVSQCRKALLTKLAVRPAGQKVIEKFVHLGFEPVNNSSEICCILDISV